MHHGPSATPALPAAGGGIRLRVGAGTAISRCANAAILVLAFAGEILSNDVDTIRDIFGSRGAYSKFKHLLVRRDALDRWHDFEATASERAFRD